jgi:hypothetical protein
VSRATAPVVMTAASGDAFDEAVTLTRRLRLTYLRKAAAEVIPAARAQRWDPAKLLRVLLRPTRLDERQGQAVVAVMGWLFGELGLTVAQERRRAELWQELVRRLAGG